MLTPNRRFTGDIQPVHAPYEGNFAYGIKFDAQEAGERQYVLNDLGKSTILYLDDAATSSMAPLKLATARVILDEYSLLSKDEIARGSLNITMNAGVHKDKKFKFPVAVSFTKPNTLQVTVYRADGEGDGEAITTFSNPISVLPTNCTFSAQQIAEFVKGLSSGEGAFGALVAKIVSAPRYYLPPTKPVASAVAVAAPVPEVNG